MQMSSPLVEQTVPWSHPMNECSNPVPWQPAWTLRPAHLRPEGLQPAEFSGTMTAIALPICNVYCSSAVCSNSA